MKLRKASANKGFTLIEILIVLTIVFVIGSWGLFLSVEQYKRYSLYSDRDLLVSALTKARSKAMNNVAESKHGVFIDPMYFIIFEGDTYATRPWTQYDENIARSPAVNATGTIEYVFERLNGEVAITGATTLDIGTRSVSVSINGEGRIEW